MFYLWIDDIRTPPNNTWHWAKSVHEAKIHFIQLGGLNSKEGVVSLDHDAGDYTFMSGDYIEFLNWLESKKFIEHFNFSNISFHLHTMNPVGYLNMRHIVKYNHWRLIDNV